MDEEYTSNHDLYLNELLRLKQKSSKSVFEKSCCRAPSESFEVGSEHKLFAGGIADLTAISEPLPHWVDQKVSPSIAWKALREIEQMPASKPTIKQKLAAIRMLYDFLVIRQVVPVNPTASVRGPKYVVKRGKTPVWSREDTKRLLESISRDDLAGLRDRALISTMLFSFARISAVLSLKRQDFYYQGPRRWLRFHEKGG
jgi:site-specific recombinase XerD